MSLPHGSTGRLVVAITGASGAIYGVRFLRHAARLWPEIHVILSGNAPSVIATELGLRLSETPTVRELLGDGDFAGVRFCKKGDFFTPPASGSFLHDGLVIAPCSMGTMGRVAAGTSDDLIARAADVCLKERRKLILVPREMPWNLVHFRNAAALTEAGATILPASPAFYHAPKSIDDLVDTVVARILQQLGAAHNLHDEWQAGKEV